MQEPTEKVLPLGLSIFGITAALSSMSFSMARAGNNEVIAKYAGEKFLHSAILLIQCLLVLYIREITLEIEWIKTWSYLVTTIRVITNIIITLVMTVATWAWFYGFEDLNKLLWNNWRQRIQDINTIHKDKSAVMPPNVDLRQ